MEQIGVCVVCSKPLTIKRYYDAKGNFKGYGASFKKKTCSRACTNTFRAGIDLAERFWSKVDRSGGDDACWPFAGYRMPDGYGRVDWRGKLELAHRVAWSLANGQPLPEDDVLHECDNPPCCNPSHLFLGSHEINMADMVVKGRSSRKLGERNGRAELSEDDVRAIRERYASGNVSQTALSTAYGVDQTTISKIVRRKLWPHVV